VNGTSEWALEIWSSPGAVGAAGNANEDADTVLGESDMHDGDTFDCVLDDDASGDARFLSMGGGDAALGDIGWLVVTFGMEIDASNLVGVYEVGVDDCDNVDVARDDEYEVFLGLDSADPDTLTLTDIETDWLSLGTTSSGGGVTDFEVP